MPAATYLADDEVALIDAGLEYLEPGLERRRLAPLPGRRRTPGRGRRAPSPTSSWSTPREPAPTSSTVNWNRWWRVTEGDACVREEDERTVVEVAEPGTIRVGRRAQRGTLLSSSSKQLLELRRPSRPRRDEAARSSRPPRRRRSSRAGRRRTPPRPARPRAARRRAGRSPAGACAGRPRPRSRPRRRGRSARGRRSPGPTSWRSGPVFIPAAPAARTASIIASSGRRSANIRAIRPSGSATPSRAPKLDSNSASSSSPVSSPRSSFSASASPRNRSRTVSLPAPRFRRRRQTPARYWS